jgi:hypothetical protein
MSLPCRRPHSATVFARATSLHRRSSSEAPLPSSSPSLSAGDPCVPQLAHGECHAQEEEKQVLAFSSLY